MSINNPINVGANVVNAVFNAGKNPVPPNKLVNILPNVLPLSQDNNVGANFVIHSHKLLSLVSTTPFLPNRLSQNLYCLAAIFSVLSISFIVSVLYWRSIFCSFLTRFCSCT